MIYISDNQVPYWTDHILVCKHKFLSVCYWMYCTIARKQDISQMKQSNINNVQH